MESKVLAAVLLIALWFYPPSVSQSHKRAGADSNIVYISKKTRADSLLEKIEQKKTILIKTTIIVKKQQDTLRKYE